MRLKLDYNIAIAGNAHLNEDDIMIISLVILMKTTEMISSMSSKEGETANITFHLSMQPIYKELNEALIKLFNTNGLRWGYFKNSFFHTPRNERATNRKGVIFITSPMTSMRDMAMLDFLNNGNGKNVSIMRETILVDDELTKAVKYVKLKESYSYEEKIILEVNKLKTLF